MDRGYATYGLTRPNGIRAFVTAHRLVAIAFLPSPLPKQDRVLHRNDDRLDIRYINLRWGTAQDNANDALANGRYALGDKHPCTAQPWTRPRGDGHASAKLTEDDVRAIYASPLKQTTLAELYQVDSALIGRIKKGQVWMHVTNAKYAAFLIDGAMNYSSPKPKRKRLTTLNRFELLKREHYRCHLCKGLIYPGQAWDVSHEIPIELNGADDDTNRRAAHRKCHREYTAKVDIPAISKAKRLRARHVGAFVKKKAMPGGRDDRLKRKLDGTTVIRSTGEPWRPGS
jgi:5-methylcytosine-specific restriction protein A